MKFLFWLLWILDALIAGVFIYFFAYGVLVDHTVSSFNIVLWLGILTALAGVIGGSLFLRAKGYVALALILLALLAVPALGLAAIMLFTLIFNPRWN